MARHLNRQYISDLQVSNYYYRTKYTPLPLQSPIHPPSVKSTTPPQRTE